LGGVFKGVILAIVSPIALAVAGLIDLANAITKFFFDVEFDELKQGQKHIISMAGSVLGLIVGLGVLVTALKLVVSGLALLKVGAVFALLLNPITWVIIAVGLLAYAIYLLIDKWDLVEKDHKSTVQFEKYIREQIAPFTDVPIVFISALTKQRIYKAIETAVEVYNNRAKRIKTSELNETLLPIIDNYPPPAYKGKFVKIKYIMQLPTPQPQFAFFCNLPQYVKDPYKRFLENKLRENFGFTGVPISVYMRKK
jgi:hypothetical protein